MVSCLFAVQNDVWVKYLMMAISLIVVGIVIPAKSIAVEPEPTTHTSTTTQTDSPQIRDGKTALSEGRYKDARDLFLKATVADPKSVAAFHGTGIASIYLQDNKQAGTILEQALQLTPSPDRALSYNSAVAEMNLANYRRAAQILRDCLYARPNSLDEPLLDALGAALQQTGDQNTLSRDSDETRKFFSVYTSKLEAQHPGLRKWGPQWLPTSEVDSKEKTMEETEQKKALLGKELAEYRGRMAQDNDQLHAARLGHGVRSAKDASQLLNSDEKEMKAKQTQYDQATATIDSVRPKYPQLLLPIEMDETTPPPIVIAPAPVAAQTASTLVVQAAAVVQTTATPSPAETIPPPKIVSQPVEVPKSVPSSPFDENDLKQCQVDADGGISSQREVKLSLSGTERQNFVLSGEIFFGGSDEAGGVLFCFREVDATHRYELSNGGFRVKRLLLGGQIIPRFANPVKMDTPHARWVPFQIEMSSQSATLSFNGSSGTVNGPLSVDGGNNVLLRPGGRLRALKLEVTQH